MGKVSEAYFSKKAIGIYTPSDIEEIFKRSFQEKEESEVELNAKSEVEQTRHVI